MASQLSFLFVFFYILQLTVSVPLAKEKSEKPVLIIGAGIAGATVAEELSKANIPFIIIEATDRVGGRLRNAKLDNINVELGANWMQGNRVGEPFFDFIRENVKLQGANSDFDDTVLLENGTVIPAEIADPVWERVEAGITASYEILATLEESNSTIDMSLRAAALLGSRHQYRTPLEIAALRGTVDFEYAQPAARVSVRGSSPLFAPDAPESDEFFVTDPRGFKASVNVLLKKAGVKSVTKSSDKLLLNAPVQSIEYNTEEKEGAIITLRNGTSYEGSAVVSTVSLGVLQNSISVDTGIPKLYFEPELNLMKRLVISKMYMADYLKFFIKLNSTVFSSEDPEFLVPIDCRQDWFINVQNLNADPYYPGSNAVLVTATDEYGRELNCLDEESALAQALEYVSDTAGRVVTRDEVVDFVIPQFYNDEFFLGAYSSRPVGVTEEELENLRKPEGSLFFAGEVHAEGGLNGYTQGSYNSGLLTSGQVIAFLKGEVKSMEKR